VNAAMDAGPRPPLGSWPRLYLLVVALALLVMAALWWFTETFNIPAGAK
jgi:hypothetical protein